MKLDEVGAEAVQIVQMIDGVNRFRFAGEPDLMAAWRAASNVVGRTGGRADRHAAADAAAGWSDPARGMMMGRSSRGSEH